jgi:SulP family sulfate permease
MSEIHGFVRLTRVAPKSDVFVLLGCYGLTVFFDMVIAVSAGVVFAAVLFMRRMAELTESRTLLDDHGDETAITVPKGVGLYEVNGPLFFGAAQKAMEAIHSSRGDRYHVMVLHLGKVPVIDSTGLVALENAIAALIRRNKVVVLAGPLPKPHRIFEKARLREAYPGLEITAHLEGAIELASRLVARRENPARS